MLHNFNYYSVKAVSVKFERFDSKIISINWTYFFVLKIHNVSKIVITKNLFLCPRHDIHWIDKLWTSICTLLTCSWHVFTNSESTNPRHFFTKFFLVKNDAKAVYCYKKRHFAAPLKENKTFFVNKIRGFVDSEFVKTCHEPHLCLHCQRQIFQIAAKGHGIFSQWTGFRPCIY